MNNLTVSLFTKEKIIDIVKGNPLTGADFSVVGPEEGWQELYADKNFFRAVAPQKGKLCLQGNMVAAMGNYNALAYMMKVLCEVV